jgi:hypothetical protein
MPAATAHDSPISDERWQMRRKLRPKNAIRLLLAGGNEIFIFQIPSDRIVSKRDSSATRGCNQRKNHMTDYEPSDKVLESFRKAEESEKAEQYAAGVRRGRTWASGEGYKAVTPPIRELQRLERAKEYHDEDWCCFFFGNAYRTGFSTGKHLFFVLRPEDEGHFAAADDFWHSEVGAEDEELESDDFIRGFADGALEVWEAVQESL